MKNQKYKSWFIVCLAFVLVGFVFYSIKTISIVTEELSEVQTNQYVFQDETLEMIDQLDQRVSATELSVKEIRAEQAETDIATKQEVKDVPTYSQDDLFCLAAVIYNEAGGNACSDECRVLVGNVVMNRVKSSLFPNSVRAVLEQNGQYAGMENGVKFAKRSKYQSEQAAVARAYEVAKRVLEGETLCPDNVIFQSSRKLGDGVYTYIDGLYFCYKKGVV